MLSRRLALVISIVCALFILSGITPGSLAVADGLSLAKRGVTIANAARPNDAVERAPSSISLAADAGPIGRQFLIADQPVDTIMSKVAYNSQAQEYLVVWRNDRPANDDIYGQRVSKDGTLIGPWFSIAAGAGVDRYYPHVAYNSQRNEFLAIWTDNVASVRGQRISATGLLIGSAWNIAAAPAGGTIYFPAVAYSSTSDEYGVVYITNVTATSNSAVGMTACTFDGSTCSPITVSGAPAAVYRYVPDLAYNHRRNEFLVVWREFNSGVSAKHIYARRVGLTGGLSALGSVFQVSSISNNEDSPVVAVVPRNPDGQYIVAWETYDVAAMDNVWAQRVAGDGTMEGSVISMASTSNDEVLGGIAGRADTEQYLFAWTSRDPTFSHSNIQGRVIAANGSFVGETRDMLPAPPGLVGASTPENAAVAAGPNGDFLITFDDVSSSIRKVYGILWGTRLYLPLILR